MGCTRALLNSFRAGPPFCAPEVRRFFHKTLADQSKGRSSLSAAERAVRRQVGRQKSTLASVWVSGAKAHARAHKSDAFEFGGQQRACESGLHDLPAASEMRQDETRREKLDEARPHSLATV